MWLDAVPKTMHNHAASKAHTHPVAKVGGEDEEALLIQQVGEEEGGKLLLPHLVQVPDEHGDDGDGSRHARVGEEGSQKRELHLGCVLLLIHVPGHFEEELHLAQVLHGLAVRVQRAQGRLKGTAGGEGCRARTRVCVCVCVCVHGGVSAHRRK